MALQSRQLGSLTLLRTLTQTLCPRHRSRGRGTLLPYRQDSRCTLFAASGRKICAAAGCSISGTRHLSSQNRTRIDAVDCSAFNIQADAVSGRPACLTYDLQQAVLRHSLALMLRISLRAAVSQHSDEQRLHPSSYSPRALSFRMRSR